jgi:hypothetical protein
MRIWTRFQILHIDFDADPDLDFYLMRMRIRKRIHPGYQNYAGLSGSGFTTLLFRSFIFS